MESTPTESTDTQETGPHGILTALDAVLDATVAPAAAGTDASGSFPRAGIDALRAAGVLGLISSRDVGGAGGSLADAATVVERIATACSSTAMIVLMHYAAVGVIEAHGPDEERRRIARGERLCTLAFSEAGSRSHFWTPLGTATPAGAQDGAPGGDRVRLDARKSWVTSAGEADLYVWSSRPIAADGPMTLWLVPSDTGGLDVTGTFDGLGLRGNASRPVTAEGATVPASARLGDDGAGLDIALATVLPTFLVLNAAFSLGVMEALVTETGRHLTSTRLEHLGQTLAEQPPTRAAFSRLRTRTDATRAFLADTLAALTSGRADATLRVLQVKTVSAEAAAEVGDGALKVCGGAAFRRELGIERRFRDALAARVMAPTTDALTDFVGRACLGQPLFDGPAR